METRATRGFHDRMAIIFDFDLTLAPATVPAVLRAMGVEEPDRWVHDRLEPMVRDGWDKILARGPLLARTAEERGVELTREFVAEVGRRLAIFEGVEDALPALRDLGRELSGGAEVELCVLSSGFVEIMGASPVAPLVDAMWGSALYWGEDGRLIGVKRAVIHSEKARYLLALAKGLDMSGADEPQHVHHATPIGEWHVPLDQMIYVGDGASDVAAFKLMHEHGGIAIGVDHSADDEMWAAADDIFESARVDNLAPPDFREGSELHRSLCLAVECVAKRIALRRFAAGDDRPRAPGA